MRNIAAVNNGLLGIAFGIGFLNASAAWAQTTFSGTGDEIETQVPIVETTDETVPDYYDIQVGDTLWGILEDFGQDPYDWPDLWSLNAQITNPHWIYPRNRIVFTRSSLLDLPGMELEGDMGRDGYNFGNLDYTEVDAECGPNIRFDQIASERKYLVTGFLAFRDEVDVMGRVAKARVAHTYMYEGDLLYLRMDDPDAFECGTVVSVFRRAQRRVRNPLNRRERLGSLYQVVGEAKIVHRYGDYLTAVVQDSWTEIQRGDLIGPTMVGGVEFEMDMTPPEGDLEAVIVGRADVESFLMGPGETVFLNIGRRQGVREGNTFYVYEQRDQYLDPIQDQEDLELPPSVIGRVMVMRVSQDSSTAVVTDADRSLWVGARVTTRPE